MAEPTSLKAPQFFQLTPPPGLGKPFFATYQVGEQDIVVFSTRGGKWAVDPKLNYADLLMPHEALNEWDVLVVTKEQAPPLYLTATPIRVDLLQMEKDKHLPHWLSPTQADPRMDEIRKRVAKKYQEKFNPKREPKK